MENHNSTTKPSSSSSSVATQQSSRLPENVECILAEADPPFDKSSPPDELYDQLCSSVVVLANKTKEFWLNKKLNCTCFMLYARALDIARGDDPNYWTWDIRRELSGTLVEVAEMKDVSYLELRGKLDTRNLSPGVMYGVSFHLMLRSSLRYCGPLKVSLKIRGEKCREREMNSSEMLKGAWMEMPVAQFIAPAHDEGGEIEFSLWDKGEDSKMGLIVKGASIKPL